jgi:hypothetical protein
MKLNEESRQWLYQEAATGNETANNASRDVNEMERYIQRINCLRVKAWWIELMFVVFCALVAVIVLILIIL